MKWLVKALKGKKNVRPWALCKGRDGGVGRSRIPTGRLARSQTLLRLSTHSRTGATFVRSLASKRRESSVSILPLKPLKTTKPVWWVHGGIET